MNRHIEVIRKIRILTVEQLTGLTIAQFNETPAGFSNNIAWNLGHLVAVQQGVCYKKTGLPAIISEDFWRRFRPGSQPEGMIGANEIADINKLLFFSLNQLETDHNKQIFSNYTTWSTHLGNELTCIDDALKFLEFHERLHARTIIAIKKLVRT